MYQNTQNKSSNPWWDIYLTMCTVHISIYPEQNFQPLVKYISQIAQSIYQYIQKKISNPWWNISHNVHSLGSKASTSGLDSAHGYTGRQDDDEDLFYRYVSNQVGMRHHFHDNLHFYRYVSNLVVMGEALQEDIGVCSIMWKGPQIILWGWNKYSVIGKLILNGRSYCILCEVQANIIWGQTNVLWKGRPCEGYSNISESLGVSDIKIEISWMVDTQLLWFPAT